MSKGLWITLIVIICIFALFFIIDFCIFINVIHLKKRLKKREYTIDSLMAQHYDLLLLLENKMVKAGIELDDKLRTSLDLYEKKERKKLSAGERIKAKAIIDGYNDSLFLLLNNSQIAEDKEISLLMNSLDEFKTRYRQEIILYNQDVYAYNYWIRFWMFFLISLIFHMRKKEQIQ